MSQALKVNLIAYNAAVSACAKGRAWQSLGPDKHSPGVYGTEELNTLTRSGFLSIGSDKGRPEDLVSATLVSAGSPRQLEPEAVETEMFKVLQLIASCSGSSR